MSDDKQSPQYLGALRHSGAHLLAAAVLELYPKALPTIGPSVENGFYYDIDFGEEKVSESDLKKIEKKMKELGKHWKEFERIEVSKQEALEHFKHNPYKQELIEEFASEDQQLTLYKSGEFTDLCRGGHVDTPSKELRNFKLLKIAGAYWRGDENNKMLTRIYGTAFATKDELAKHLKMLEEAKKRDHRKLGKELELFMFSDLIGPGMPVYLPKGYIVRNEIVEYSRELNKKIGFQEVHTPNVNKADLFRISGHYDLYKDDMLEVKSHYTDEDYFLKPMNCPQHTQVYANKTRSYRDLPVRISDFANTYRDEKPGELAGLTRLRCFVVDDGHSFCREDQIEDEFRNVLTMVKEALDTYGLDHSIRLSLRDPENKDKYLGDDAIWDKAESRLKKLLEENNVEFQADEGEAAFYGPKMDIMAHDCLGRTWQISTIQLDLNMPVRFGLKYVDADGNEQTPVMIHRALVGSPERFMGILIEHYAGAFPVWLAPTQVQIIPVGEGHIEFSQKLAAQLTEHNVRTHVDDASETVGNKIRKSTKEKIPYMLVIGDKEMKSPNLHIRRRGSEDLEELPKEDFITQVKQEITDKVIW